MARIFLYMRSRLSADQVRIAIEALPKKRRDERNRGWFIGPPDKEAFVFRMDEAQLAKHRHDLTLQERRRRGLVSPFGRRMNTALVVYIEDREHSPHSDLVSPIQLLADHTALDWAEMLAHRLKSHGVVVVDDTENNGGILRVNPSDHTRL